MTQGIRSYVNARFAKYLPKFQAGELDGKSFRAKVMEGAVKHFGITQASAATHYNHALKMTRLADPKAVEGLGRPEDKKGGRSVLHPVTVVNARTGKVVVEGISKGAADIIIAKAGVLKNGENRLTIQVNAEAPAEEDVSAEAQA